jgi:hypothetical protein
MQTQLVPQLRPCPASSASTRAGKVVSIDDLATTRRQREEPDAEPHPVTLRCVHSDYLADGESCAASVPARVATGAWQRERLERLLQDGFFRFQWRGEVWLGYGLSDGAVRGVYCAEHNAERSERYHRRTQVADRSSRRGRAALSIV